MVKANTTSEKRKLKYAVEFTIGEKRALTSLVSSMKVVDVPECIDIIHLKKALNKLKA